MLQQDYLMRTIQALTQAFLNLIGATDKSPATLRMELDDTLSEHFKTQPELLAGMDVGRLDHEPPEVCAQLARMFALQAGLSRELDDSIREAVAVRWALRAFERGFSVEVSAEIEEAAFAFLRGPSAGEHARIPSVRSCYVALFRSAFRRQRLENAEDALFAAIDLGASDEVVAEARDLFQQVLDKPHHYENADLTAAEIRQILDDLA